MIDKTNVKQFRDDLEATLKTLGEKYGVILTTGRTLSYGTTDGHVKVEWKAVAASPNGTLVPVVNPRHEALAQIAFAGVKFRHNNPAGKTIIGNCATTMNGDAIRILDYDTRKPKYPVIYKKLCGGAEGQKQWKAPVSFIKEVYGMVV